MLGLMSLESATGSSYAHGVKTELVRRPSQPGPEC
jgi:hypothetical protein